MLKRIHPKIFKLAPHHSCRLVVDWLQALLTAGLLLNGCRAFLGNRSPHGISRAEIANIAVPKKAIMATITFAHTHV